MYKRQRGYLTRKHIHGDTTSTSGPSIVDSDQSLGNLSTSREEEGPVRSNISMEEESEICRHQISPEISEELKQTNSDQPRRPTDKRMSLGSNIIEQTTATVSYTHLDVYKRQVLDKPIVQRNRTRRLTSMEFYYTVFKYGIFPHSSK